MSTPTKPASKPADAPAGNGSKPKTPRKKLTLSGALRRIELIMEQFSPEAKLKLAEYATMHAQEQQPTKPTGAPSGT